MNFLSKLNKFNKCESPWRKVPYTSSTNKTHYLILSAQAYEVMLSGGGSWRNDITNWEEFVRTFVEKYWSCEVRREIKQKLEVGIYQCNESISRSEYFIEKVY